MKTLKISNIIATIIIILLVFLVVELRNELTQTKAVLQQWSDRYYEAIGKKEKNLTHSRFSEKSFKVRDFEEGNLF